jgi:hypothetical protein
MISASKSRRSTASDARANSRASGILPGPVDPLVIEKPPQQLPF